MAEQEVKSDEEKLAKEWEAMGVDADQPESPAAAGADAIPAPLVNQNEMNSLLGFDGTDEQGKAASGISAIIASALVSYERLPMLEVALDRLVRLMSTSLRNFTSDNVDVSIDNITSIRFGDYLNAMSLPVMSSVFKAEQWDNYALLTVDAALIYSMVDVLLGGRRGVASTHTAGRPYTTIERNLVERLVAVVLTDLSAAFEPLTSVTFRFDRLETNPRFATIARPGSAAVLACFRIDMEDRGGQLELLFPYATLEPVREILLQGFLGEKFGRDSIWEAHLAGELWQTGVSIEAVLDSIELPLRDVLNLKVGSHIRLNAHVNSDVKLVCGDRAMFTGKMGRKAGAIAVRITETVDKDRGTLS
jgi:flagellar motor switch protein FliM